jgi:hypothetical protein
MRALIVGAFAAATVATAAPAQQADSTPRPAPSIDGRLRAEIGVLRTLFGSIRAPEADRFQVGNLEVPQGSTRQGTVAVARGNLAVRGHIAGDAIALHGDVIIHPGGIVDGNAIAVDGRVRTIGGVVGGDVRSIRGIAGSILSRAAGEAGTSEPIGTWAALKMVIGWFAVLFAIGIGILLFAERNLDAVVGTLEHQFARAFWVGVLAQLAAIPALLIVLVALAVSIIGILLIPFAVVAYVVVLAGLLTLGFIAVSRFTGRAFFRDAVASRKVNLRSLFLGLGIYLGLWFLAAIFVWNPVVGSVLRAVALAGTWVALSFGLGATILTRAGTRDVEQKRQPRPSEEMSWQTPTPVTGVAAARRPVAAVKER